MPKLDTKKSVKTALPGDLNYSGYFDWAELYGFITGWMSKNQLKLYEPVFKDKTSKEGYTDRELTLYGEKKVDLMNKYMLTVEVKMWDCQDVDVTKDGKTQKLCRGRFRIRISANIDNDFQGLFNKSEFWKKFYTFYEHLIKWDWNFEHWDYWYTKCFELHSGIRRFLNMDSV